LARLFRRPEVEVVCGALCCGKSVVAVNHLGDKTSDVFVSDASCTIACLALLMKVVHMTCAFFAAFMTIVHAKTATQVTADGPSRGGKDGCGGCCASQSIIPSSTGVAKAVGTAVADANGKLMGMALRVLAPGVSMLPSVRCGSCEAELSFLRLRARWRGSGRSTSASDRRATGAGYKYWKALSARLWRPMALRRSSRGVEWAEETQPRGWHRPGVRLGRRLGAQRGR